MKKERITYIVTLLVFPFGLMPVVLGQDRMQLTAEDLLASYTSYVEGDHNQAIASMESMGLQFEKESIHLIQPAGEIDSLTFGSFNQSKATFRSVDINYLRNVSATFKLKIEESRKLLEEVAGLMEQKGLYLNDDRCQPGVCAVFREQSEYFVVDRRWSKPTYTKFESFYHHLLATYNDWLILEFSETIPMEWVTREMLPDWQEQDTKQEFRIIAASGNVEIKNAAKQPIDVQTGAFIPGGAMIYGQAGSYIALMGPNGGLYEITDHGTHEVDELMKGQHEDYGVIRSYVDYLMDQFFESSRDDKFFMASVSRTSDSELIRVHLPTQGSVFKSRFITTWEAWENESNYMVVAEDLYNRVIWQSDTAVPNYQVDLSLPALKGQPMILFYVHLKDNPSISSKKHLISQLGESERAEISSKLLVLQSNLKNEKLLNYLVLAAFFEQEKLLIDAWDSYQQAVENDRDVSVFKKLKAAFISRNLADN